MLSNSPINIVVMISHLDIVEAEAQEEVMSHLAMSL